MNPIIGKLNKKEKYKDGPVKTFITVARDY